MNSQRATGGSGDTEACPDVRPSSEELQQARLDWAGRLIGTALALFPLAAISFAWLFHPHLSVIATALGTLLLAAGAASSAGALIHSRRVAEQPRSEGTGRGRILDLSRVGHAMAVVVNALAFSAPPWVVGRDGEPMALLALLFPLLALSIAVVVYAPMRRWFLFHQALVATPTLVWALTADGPPGRWALSATVLGLVTLTLVLHREVHRLLTRSLAVNARNLTLVRVLQRERTQMEQTNSALEDANARLQRQVSHDSLTGVLNRRGLEERLDTFFREARLAERHLAVLFCDLDRFKVVNDTFGHEAGDRLLVTVAERISGVLPDSALLARLGGDEFVVVVSFTRTETDPGTTGLQLAERVREAVAGPLAFEEREFFVTTTVGVALVPDRAMVSIDVLRPADRALHYAKRTGRDRAELFDGALTAMTRRAADEAHLLRRAIDSGRIVPWYQPIVDARSGTIVGAELLARWINPDGRAVPASEFIELARDSVLVDRLSEVLTGRAIEDLIAWERLGLPEGFRVGFNLPPRFTGGTARHDALVDLLLSGPAHRMTIEVSESSVIDDRPVAAARLGELRTHGLHIVLDDLGTGSAPLSLLQHLPLDGMKIDRSFVRDITCDVNDQAMVSGLVLLAGKLGLEVTAEGVETLVQASALVELGCVRQQGFLYGEAVDAAELLTQLGHLGRGPTETSATR